MSRCPWKIRWTFGKDAQCMRDEHVSNVQVRPSDDGTFRSSFDGDPEHRALLENGVTTLSWQAGDRREYTGPWPGVCERTLGCTLPGWHHGRCAP